VNALVRLNIGVILVMISAASFAATSVLAKLAYSGGANVGTLLAIRFFLAALLLWGICIANRIPLKVKRSDFISLMLLGIIGYATMSSCMFTALALIPASTASLLLYTYPAIVWSMESLIGREVFSFKKGLLILIVFVGLVLVTGGSVKGNAKGMLFGIGAAVFYSGYIIAGNQTVKEITPFLVSAYVMSASGVFFLLKGFIFRQINLGVTLQSLAAMIGIALATVVAVLFFFMGMKVLGPTNASIISTLEPLVTIWLAALLFSERLKPIQMAGGLFILAGITMLLKSSQTEKKTLNQNIIGKRAHQ
jgi:drug/metabolite transporter (DMT)-like permease